MKKYLVPTDFSETAKNAARYAVQLAAHDPSITLVLYHVYSELAPGSDGTPLTETEDDRRKVLGFVLENLTAELQSLSPVKIEYEMEAGTSLVESIETYVRHKGISLVIMGITGGSRMEQILMGSNTVDMAREGACPVIIVPPEAGFQRIRQVLLASDFKDVQLTTPVQQIKSVLHSFKPALHIVHVGNEDEVKQSEEYSTERAWLESVFESYSPQFSFVQTADFLDAINNFTADHQIDLIITVPKRHPFLSGLFTTSHTKKLAYHSHVPVVAVHD